MTMRLIKIIAGMFGIFIMVHSGAAAEGLDGIYNTGPSLEEEADGSSLNIRFHSCEDDATRSCATIVELVEPEGASGETTLPDGSPIVGYTMITGLKSKGDGKYRSGNIAAIDESMIKGKMIWYGLKIDNPGDSTLIATGCLGFICPRKMVWTSVEEGDLSADIVTP